MGIGEKIAALLYRGSRDFVFRHFPKKSLGAEVGVFRGDFSERILKKAKPKTLHLIDPWYSESDDRYRESLYGEAAGASQQVMDEIYRSVEKRFAKEIKKGRVQIHRLASGTAAEGFADNSLDWAYIDGNHLYEFVRNDLESYFQKIKPGGLLAGDDYGVKGWWDDGVTKAVDEFIKSKPVEVLELRKSQFVLKKKA